MKDAIDRQEALFTAALALPAPDRPAYLAQACADDPALRQQVEILLRAHEVAGDFLDAPAPSDARESAAAVTQSASSPGEKPGDRIGRYKLLQKIGEGGCGVVYLAEQEEPVHRRVALKVIKLGMDTKEVIARFEAERQALALMDHPNIAHVFDAGATESGRPYFVMELVRGLPITKFCDEQNLSTAARLDLFSLVCHAVQHAHQKGIIHRDLKPSNILVSLHDGASVPKVIDFGIAKATQGRLTDATLFTAFEQFIGTPAYMSPEQAEVSGLDIDTRSDIYSLGVLLYELLTGRTPFDARELVQAGLDEIRRRIREEEPPKPSTRLSTMEGEALTVAARRRQTEPPKLLNLVRGDLDWIVMKCLEKDRTRRYETANGLAEDIRRHLSHQPVGARSPGVGYTLGKFVRRHRAVFAAASAVVFALLAGTVVSTWQAWRATRAERAARIERDRAEAGEQRAHAEATRAENLAQKETALRQRAEQLTEQIRENLYVARINGVQQDFDQGDTVRVLALLDSLRPAPGQADLRGFEWYYFWRLCHAEKIRLVGHPWTVRTVAFSPDGRTIASAGQERAIRLWDAQTGEPRGLLEGHTSWVSAVAYSADGTILASGSADGTVRLWDPASGRPLFIFPKETGEVTCLAFAPRGHRLAVGLGEMATGAGTPLTKYLQLTNKGGLKILDARTRREIAAISDNPKSVISLAWSTDGRTLAAGSGRMPWEVRIWDVNSRKKLATLPRFSGPVFGLAFSPAGQSLVTGSWYPWDKDAELAWWNPQDWSAPPSLKRRVPPLVHLAFAPDGRTLATAGKDGTAHVWQVSDGAERASFKGNNWAVTALAFSPDGRTVATGCGRGDVRLWDVTRNPVHDVLPSAPGFRFVFTPDNQQLICAAANEVQIWSVAERRRLYSLPLMTRAADVQLAISGDGRVLAVISSQGLMHVFDLPTRQLRHLVRTLHQDKVGCVAVSPDGRTIATASSDRTAKLWDAASGKERVTLSGHSSRVGGLAFTPDGRTLITGSQETKLWDVATGALQQTWKTPATNLEIARDGKMLAARSASTEVKLLELPTGRELGGLMGHTASIWRIAFAPDRRTLVTASIDGTAKLWRVPTGELLLTVPSALGTAFCAAFSADGTALAIGSGSSGSEQGGTQIVLLRAATKAEADQPERVVPVVKSSKHGDAAPADDAEKPDLNAKEPGPSPDPEPTQRKAPPETAPKPTPKSTTSQPSRTKAAAPRPNPAEAIAAATRAIEQDPTSATAYNSRGYLRQNSGDLAGAVADFNQAIALAPSLAGAYSNRGNNWMAQGDLSGAITDYDKAIALDKDRSAYPYLYRHLCIRRLRPDEATTSFAATVAAWKDSWPKSIGRYLLGELPEEEFLALAARGGGRTSNARPCEAYYYAGMAHLLRGEPTMAREYWKKCLALNETTLTATVLARRELARLPSAP